MKKLLLITSFLLYSLTNSAQNTTCNWAYAPVGPNSFNGKVYNTAIDHQGNIIECGTIGGIADMNPGNGPADTAFTQATYNYYLRKTTSGGQLIWIRYFNHTTPVPTFNVHGLEVNSQNEIIIAGDYFGTIDMDLSPTGTDTINSHQPTYPDFFLAKYNATADLQWAHTFGGTTGNIGAASIALRTNDEIIVSFSGGANMDLDPTAGTALAFGGSANIACYNSNGDYLWNNQISTPTSYAVTCKSIACDASDNSYLLSVGYYELTVTKFGVNGNELWTKTIGDFQNMARVEPHSLLVDPNGDFFIVGKYLGSVDFDPNGGVLTHNSSSVNDHDGFFAAWDSSMNPYWVKTYEGKITFGHQSLAKAGNEFITGGQISGTVTISPGQTLSSGTNSPFLLKTDLQGNCIAAYAFPCFGWFTTINLPTSGNLVTTGIFSGSVDIDPTASGTITLTSNANSGSFTAVYGTQSNLTEVNEEEEILVFPNPAKDQLKLQHSLNSLANVSIISPGGKYLIEQFLLPGETLLNTESLPAGIYMLRIQTETAVTATRFTIID